MNLEELALKVDNWINNLSDKNPLKKVVVSIKEKAPEKLETLYNDFFNQPEKEVFPKPVLPNSEKNPTKTPEKKSEKIKRNSKKIMLNAANAGAVATVWTMKASGKAVKWSGRAVKLSGRLIQGAAAVGYATSLAVQGTGKVLQGTGKLIQAGGNALTAALAGTKIGYILTPVSAGLTGLGVGVSGAGKGLDTAGKASRTYSKQVNNFGRKVVKTGDKITQTGKKIEKNANRLNNIRKYYLNKERQKLNQPAPQRSHNPEHARARVSLFNRLSENSYQGGLAKQSQKPAQMQPQLNQSLLFNKNNNNKLSR